MARSSSPGEVGGLEILARSGNPTNADLGKWKLSKIESIRKLLSATQPLHGQLALSNGAQVFATHARWAESALAEIKRKRR